MLWTKAGDPGYVIAADLDGDGVIGDHDLALFLQSLLGVKP